MAGAEELLDLEDDAEEIDRTALLDVLRAQTFRLEQEIPQRRNPAAWLGALAAGREWGLDDERFTRLRADSIVMHPGPMNRGLEISSRAADSPQSSVLEQVANGVSVRMAALYLLLSGEKGE